MISTRKRPAVWTVLHHSRRVMSIKHTFYEGPIIPFFSTPSGCDSWILHMGLEQHFCSPPLWPPHLRDLVEFLLDDGMRGYVLDPPNSTAIQVRVGDLEALLERVVATPWA